MGFQVMRLLMKPSEFMRPDHMLGYHVPPDLALGLRFRVGHTKCGDGHTYYGFGHTNCGAVHTYCGAGHTYCGAGHTNCGAGHTRLGLRAWLSPPAGSSMGSQVMRLLLKPSEVMRPDHVLGCHFPPDLAWGFRFRVGHTICGARHTECGAGHTDYGFGHTYCGAVHTYCGAVNTYCGAGHTDCGAGHTNRGAGHTCLGPRVWLSPPARSSVGLKV